jgi:hypothetical protein
MRDCLTSHNTTDSAGPAAEVSAADASENAKAAAFNDGNPTLPGLFGAGATARAVDSDVGVGWAAVTTASTNEANSVGGQRTGGSWRAEATTAVSDDEDNYK